MLVANDLIQSSISRQPDLDSAISAVSGKNPVQFESRALLDQRKEVLRRQSAEFPEFALERLLGKNDLLPFNYFLRGQRAGKAVARILVKNADDDLVAYGTGFMISPVLMMTNKHVLPTDGDVHTSQLEFGYEQDVSGSINNSVVFDLDPTTFFYADPLLDFSITAVRPKDVTGQHLLSDYGYLLLNPEKGKVALGEYLSIIQHPDGREKKIAIRENQVVDHDSSPDHIWYKTDTTPGSSGSPVFNDQWQLVALHHMGVPDTDAAGNYIMKDGSTVAPGTPQIDADKLVWKANEGVRVSRIVQILGERKAGDPLVQHILETGVPVEAKTTSAAAEEKPTIIKRNPQPLTAMENNTNTNSLTFTVPLNISISLGSPLQAPAVTTAVQRPFAIDEASLVVDPDYNNRVGFVNDFLGVLVKMPEVKPELAGEVTALKDNGGKVLKYHHFSVVMSKPRKMAWFTGVNIDSVSWARLKDQIPSRKEIGADTWRLDPRLEPGDQIPKEFYKGNDFDIGHQVRREDPIWGQTIDFAIKCNNDTFHLSNACPQHREFNQGLAPANPGDTTSGKTLWQGLENFILDNARQNGLKVNVFTGPVLGKDDKEYQNTGILVPEAFWKVVVIPKASGGLSATAYLVSQASLIDKMMEDFVFGKYRTYQVAVKHIEDLTGLSFGLAQFDPLDHLPLNANEALELQRPAKIRVLNSVHDIVF